MERDCIIGEKVYLRPVTRNDIPMIVKWRNSDLVRPYFFYRGEFTIESQTAWYEANIETGKAIQFIICDKVDAMPLGMTVVQYIENAHKRGDYGFYLGEPTAYGKGIGNEIARLTVEYMFQTLHFHKLTSRAFSDNQRSLKSMMSAGFRQEGILRDEVFLDGRYQDVILLGVINQGK